MRYILTIILLITSGFAYGQEKASPALEDYEKILNYYTELSKKCFKIDDWKGVELRNKKTKEEIKFDDLSNYEKHMFCISMGERTSKEMAQMNDHWSDELEKFTDPKYKPTPRKKIDNPKQKPAEKADIEKYTKQLVTLRKTTAVAFEKFVEKSMNDFKEEISEKERKLYLKQVREFHDENKLIERKKGK